ncbi:hypothetical protein EYF80_030852 [Liparis tanakae]|uniref:Uncharacterized protein n=1 Tax=Liparis tanakae TaxID=230148 RepID=A0A4Z2GZM0_9TELE|nr:hypothetical protein EYF80_030852 [Liparis tanakae]
MPAILVASKMKSGLPKPKPVHSALPIPQSHGRPSALALPAAPLKTHHVPSPGRQVGAGPPRSFAPGSEDREDSQTLSSSASLSARCHREPLGADKRVIVSAAPRGICG